MMLALITRRCMLAHVHSAAVLRHHAALSCLLRGFRACLCAVLTVLCTSSRHHLLLLRCAALLITKAYSLAMGCAAMEHLAEAHRLPGVTSTTLYKVQNLSLIFSADGIAARVPQLHLFVAVDTATTSVLQPVIPSSLLHLRHKIESGGQAY